MKVKSGKLPYGFCKQIAKEMNISVQTAWNALNGFTDSVKSREIRSYAENKTKKEGLNINK
jgi:hypothetical protein